MCENKVRKNLPITQTEYRLSPDAALVSTTDEKGRIVHCNESFIEASGFTRDELIGQPHNLIRHPDMPEEAFRDMWATIQQGRLWTGMVKNRRQNGDHYWVNANVTPLTAGDRIVGYLSVRETPSREAVAEAERLYAKMRGEAERGRLVHRLSEGHVWRSTVFGRLTRALRFGPNGRLAMLSSAFIAAASAAGIVLNRLGLPDWAHGVIALTLAGLLYASLRAMLLTPVKEIEDFAKSLAACDLGVRFKSDRAGVFAGVGMALSQVSQNTRAVIADVRAEIDAMGVTLTELAASKQDLSNRTESQAAALQETASAMEEITTSVRVSADQARSSAGTAKEAREITEHSHRTVGEVVQTMDQIGESSRRVSEIVNVIESIAFQTNILALNASVEAARAGDQGRGFAVVASEVRSLAQRSGDAAKEIHELISESAAHVNDGLQVTRKARDTIDTALAQVISMGSLAEEIADGAAEQSNGISQVGEAVTHLDSVTQQNTAMVEELAASSAALSRQADELSNSVRLFRLGPNDNRHSLHGDAVQMRRDARRGGARAKSGV
ncbi:MAG: methyl-accepting chemotaxis protein [Burkholderiaceae bacterium]